ncbi:MAG TPA: cupredoxin domain-containing protein [Acidimicrobiia bacterium]|nr:cupredoxin domain-containing protein [Acidimicrobiia bacterium]
MRKTCLMLVVLAALLAGCAGEDREPAATIITMEGLSFGAPVSVAVGEPLTIRNADTVSHTWTAVDFSFNSSNISPGDDHTHTFDAAGEYPFFCEIHPTMSGSVTVTG